MRAAAPARAVCGRALALAALLALTPAPLSAQEAAGAQPEQTPVEETQAEGTGGEGGEYWGVYAPAKGFKVAKTDYGELNISIYILWRYINQLPGVQSYYDHLGRLRPIDTRNDIQLHREMLFFSGFIYSPKLRYQSLIWTVNSTTQVAVAGYLSYAFHEAFQLYGGIGGLPGTRSLSGVFPYFLGTDRQMADDFFRPGFTGGVWAMGEPLKGLRYIAMVGDNLSILGVNATQLTRSLAASGSVWWMPTTGEFGPRGGFGDYERHRRAATRVGVSYTHSKENRFSQPPLTATDNTQVHLADGTLFFDPETLAVGVTAQDANYDLLSLDAGLKYRGFALNLEGYYRWMTHIVADGPLPFTQVLNWGLYVQPAYEFWPGRLELFGAFSCVLGDFGPSWEVAGGANVYPGPTRNWRINAELLYVHRSAMTGLFGFYIGGQTGPIVVLASDLFL